MVDTSAVTKWIAKALIQEGKYLYGVEDRVRALERELECVQELLQEVDANPSLVRQDGQLRIFTQQIRELAFRAEDAIDTYVVDVGSKVYNKNLLLKLACLAFRSYPVHMLRKEIEAIQGEIEEAKKRCEDYRKMMPNPCQQQLGNVNIGSIAENYLHLNYDDEINVVGIEDDITRLVKRLTDPEDDFKVLAIVGTGGAGKTTLASQIFRHNKVESWFSHRAFVSVSQQWSRLDLLRRIFKEVMGHSEIPSSEAELVRELHDFMKDRQCLVVLDDIWKKEAWDDIYPIFPRTKGVRVMLTTRIEQVPLYADNKCILHEPHLLTDDQKWALFSKVAVEGRPGIENNAEFDKFGKQMLEKCQGLPLAVVTLAGILRTKQQLYEWEGISKACSDSILQGKGGSTYGVVEDMLELSYIDLPAHLKPCFLYLAIIPEDTEFSSKQITQMWIAEGFITNDHQMRCETLEDAAMRSLTELAQRYILQVVKRNPRGQIEEFRLHDLMRDFCIKKATEYHLLQTQTSMCLDIIRRPSQPRRLSVFSRECCLEENHHLRSLVYFGGRNNQRNIGVIRKLDSIHKEFKLLRVLSINNCENDGLPKQIGNLIHLTYLSLVNTRIRELPESIRNLRNLLHLEYDYGATVVPNDLVGKMENLRLLDLPRWLERGSCNTLGLRGSKKLQTLSCGAGTWMTEDLPTLSTTVVNLDIKNVMEIEEMEAIYGCLNILKGSLLTFKCWFNDDAVVGLEFHVLEILVDCQALWSLDLYARLPNNCTIQFPPNLVSLSLRYSNIGEGVDLMEVLGRLSRLKYLSLSRSAYLGAQLSCAGTAFPQLRELRLERLIYLEEWRMGGCAMNGLEKLEIVSCSGLKRLPERIRSIITLKELVIRRMPEEFCTRLGYGDGYGYGGSSVVVVGGGEDYCIIQHIPSVKVYWRG